MKSKPRDRKVLRFFKKALRKEFKKPKLLERSSVENWKTHSLAQKTHSLKLKTHSLTQKMQLRINSMRESGRYKKELTMLR